MTDTKSASPVAAGPHLDSNQVAAVSSPAPSSAKLGRLHLSEWCWQTEGPTTVRGVYRAGARAMSIMPLKHRDFVNIEQVGSIVLSNVHQHLATSNTTG